MSKLSHEEYAKRLSAVRYARATSALEGIRPTELLLELQARFLSGEITIEESIAEAQRHYGLPETPEAQQD